MCMDHHVTFVIHNSWKIFSSQFELHLFVFCHTNYHCPNNHVCFCTCFKKFFRLLIFFTEFFTEYPTYNRMTMAMAGIGETRAGAQDTQVHVLFYFITILIFFTVCSTYYDYESDSGSNDDWDQGDKGWGSRPWCVSSSSLFYLLQQQ